MERLTEKCWRNLDPWECCGQDYYCKRGCHDEGGCTKGCIVPRIYARLAAYEDTGLEPEGVEQAKFALIGKSIAEIKEFNGVPLARMIELAQAEKDGRLVVLPPNDPLTLEELREMEGEPVWVTHRDGSGGRWGIVNIYPTGICADVCSGQAYWFKDYIGTISYRRKPEEGAT